MKLITNTNEIKYGDIILGLPRATMVNPAAFIRLNKNTDIRYVREDSCFDVSILPEDVESFAEECYIAKCIMADEHLYLVDLKTGDTLCWDKDFDTWYSEYTIWKLDVKF